jgi:hypothetical protein
MSDYLHTQRFRNDVPVPMITGIRAECGHFDRAEWAHSARHCRPSVSTCVHSVIAPPTAWLGARSAF